MTKTKDVTMDETFVKELTGMVADVLTTCSLSNAMVIIHAGSTFYRKMIIENWMSKRPATGKPSDYEL